MSEESVPIKPCRKCGSTDRYAPTKGNRLGACRVCAKNASAAKRAGVPKAPKPDNTKPCPTCGSTDRKKPKEGLNVGECKNCSSIRTKAWFSRPEAKERMRVSNRKRRAGGLTPEEQEALLLSQNGLCGSCGDPFQSSKTTHLDHDHDTDEAWAFLCHWCNTAKGLLKNSADRAQKLAAYIIRHKK